ncbi:GntR family transcriptional regulator [Oceanobacillus alkalisoli]|uniref:GntR family transcriptional regulator n=1 Tax=Oceanobacillus alkalisoli TaxID=2925113 RepID=UPI001EE3FB02|nr:GntR family transcriptional regulator [Oceanobacillus alkalisoli]MCG5102578.1 GntR family transcriptional regulator [Oceanobacillus alkalisoli]
MDENNGIPLYYQLKELIKENISKGVWKPEEKIPNEIELAEQYNISRSTVRQAILPLVREGLLYRKQGRGTFVSKPKLAADFINFYLPRELGNKHVLVKLKEIEPSDFVREALRLDSIQKVYELSRIRYIQLANEEPVAIEKSYIASDLVPSFTDHTLDGRLHDLLNDEYGIKIVNAESYIDPVIVDEYEASQLDVEPVTPALKITRIAKQFNEEPVVLTISIIRGDRCRIFLKSEQPVNQM